MAAGVLTLDGVAYDQAARAAGNLIVDGFGWDLDGDSWLEFHEHHGGPEPRFKGDLAVTYVDFTGALRFTGTLTSARPSADRDGRGHGYRCQGYRYRLNQHPFRAQDGTGSAAYNLSPVDEQYVQADAGRSVGWILDKLLVANAATLAACGVSTDATTASQLAALDFVPPDRVRVAGERLGDALAAFLGQWLPSKRLDYTPAGLVRVADVAEGSERTVTMGVDPIEPPLFARSWSDCASRVVVRGGADVDGAHVGTAVGGLAPAWSAEDEAGWTWSDFEAPADATDGGAVASIDGPDQITVTSAKAWPTVGYWSDRQARVYLTKTTAVGLEYTESRPIVGSSTKAAGGSGTLTLGYPLSNSASDAYDGFRMVGTVAPLVGSGPGEKKSNAYRLYAVTTPGGWVEDHLVPSFPVPWPFFWLNQSAVYLTSSPSAMLFGPSSDIPAHFTIQPSTGHVLFDRPVVERFNERTALESGAALVVPDVLMLLAYSRGSLEVAHPPDVGGVPQHEGTAHSWCGLERTRYADFPAWTYRGNQALVQQMAAILHESISDTVVEGPVRWYGAWTDVWSRGDGHRLNVASNLGTTGDEALAIPVRAVSVRIIADGGGLLYATEARCSTRRDLRCSTAGYQHLSQLGEGAVSPSRQDDYFAPLGGEAGAAVPPSVSYPGDGGGGSDVLATLDRDWSTEGGNTSGRYSRGRASRETGRREERAGPDPAATRAASLDAARERGKATGADREAGLARAREGLDAARIDREGRDAEARGELRARAARRESDASAERGRIAARNAEKRRRDDEDAGQDWRDAP